MPSNFNYTESFINGNDNVMTSPAQNATFSDGSSQKIALVSAQGYYLQLTISSETVTTCADYDTLKKKNKYLGNGWYPLKTWFVNNGFSCGWSNNRQPWKPTKNNSTALWDAVYNKLLSSFSYSSSCLIFGGSMAADDAAYQVGEDNTKCAIHWSQGSYGPTSSSSTYVMNDWPWGKTPNTPVVFLKDC